MNDKYGYGDAAIAPKVTAFDQFERVCNEVSVLRNRVDALSAKLLGDKPKPTGEVPQSPPGLLNRARCGAQMALGMIGEINEELSAIEREVA